MNVYIGTCGYPVSRSKYYSIFKTIEIQETFYDRPNIDKLKKLRSEAPSEFIFNMKAWQAITHPPNLPTWRRSKFKVPKDKVNSYGYLRPTKENFEAWEIIRRAAKALECRVIVIQLPSSFRFSKENLSNAIEFFNSITPTGFILGLELRGDWREHPNELRNELILRFKEVIHVTDPFRWSPVTIKPITYFRLHGIGKYEVNYRYKYRDEDLVKLKEIVSSVISSGASEVFVMFNNVYMFDDAKRFLELMTSKQS